MIEITKEEVKVLEEFIELYFFDAIRNDKDIDNMYWVQSIVHVWEKCKEAGEQE